MSHYFFSGQGKGTETTDSDIYESRAEVIRLEYEITRSLTCLYKIVGSRDARACPKQDHRSDHLLGGDVNPDFDSCDEMSSLKISRFFDTDGLFQCKVRVFGWDAFTSSIRRTDA